MTMTEPARTALDQAGAEPALLLRDLHVAYGHGSRTQAVVHGIDLRIHRGQTLALVGQSGSGKSTIAQAVAGLLPPNGRITSGQVGISGREVTHLTGRQWRPLRGAGVGYVPQDPLSSLDPLQAIGRQVGQALLLHTDATRRNVAARTTELLGHVGIRNPESRLGAYPHELSGGQLQRVLIAIAIAGRPQLLIADEPTSALDVTVQKTILDLLGALQEELGSAILFITHDLAVAADRSDHIAVLNQGRVVDSGPLEAVLQNPSNAYTRQLFADAPATSPDRYRRPDASPTDVASGANVPEASINVESLVKYFGDPAVVPAAVDDVGFSVRRGSVHALVGESGSGKTTIARIIAGLESFSSGSVTIDGRALQRHPEQANPFARQLQLVYQNPLAALDPKFTIRQSLEEPLRVHRGEAGTTAASDRERRVMEVMERVALSGSLLDRRPREISGGQRQRVAVARALVLAPEILVLDEPTSALDVTVQAQIIDLLHELRDEQNLTYLFISHDLSLVRQIADEVSVLERGRLVESGPVSRIFHGNTKEYTRRLLESIPGASSAAIATTNQREGTA